MIFSPVYYSIFQCIKKEVIKKAMFKFTWV